MFFSGLLVNLQQARGINTYRWESTADLDIARLVRDQTAPHTVFATAPRLDHPISTLTGRPVIMSYWGWLATRGFDVQPREQALRDIYALAPNLDAVLAEYEVDYVVIGPTEREDYEPDVGAWEQRFPVAIRNDEYQIFAVSPAAQRQLDRERQRGATQAAAPASPSPGPSSSLSNQRVIVGPRRRATPVMGTPGAGTLVGATPGGATPVVGTPAATPLMVVAPTAEPAATATLAPPPSITSTPRPPRQR